MAIRKTSSPKERSAAEPSASQEDTVQDLRSRMELLQSRLAASKIAFMNRSEFDGKMLEFEDLSNAAEALIDANYQLQRLLYGKVRVKLSVAKLLRGKP